MILLLMILCCLSSCSMENTDSFQEVDNSIISKSRVISKGELLFRHHCVFCHDVNLRKNSTASPLGKISSFRDSLYLISSVKNFLNLVEEGNEIAICQFDKYAKNMMLPYDFLEAEEIWEIFDFIEEESKRQGIHEDEMKQVMDCPRQILNVINREDTIFQIEIEVNSIYEDILMDFQKRASPNFSQSILWKENNFSINVKSTKFEVVKVFEIDREMKILTPLFYNKGRYFYNLPNFIGEEIRIADKDEYEFIGIEESDNKKLSFGIIKLQRNELNQEVDLEMRKVKRRKIIKYFKN